MTSTSSPTNASARKVRWHWPGTAELRATVKAVVAVGASILIAELLHLPAPQWAGIIATAAVGGTIGANYRTMLVNLTGTFIGLGISVGLVLLFGASTPIALIAVFLAFVISGMLNLVSAQRYSALTALIIVMAPTSPAHPEVAALTRIAYVLIGSLVPIAVNMLLWPQHAEKQLETALHKTVTQAYTLTSEALTIYAGGPDCLIDLHTQLIGLRNQTPSFSRQITEAIDEQHLAFGANHLDALQRAVSAVYSLYDNLGLLLNTVGEASRAGDQLQTTLHTEILDVAGAFRMPPAASLDPQIVHDAVSKLVQRYEVLRAQGVTLQYSGEQLLRFATVIFLCQMLAKDVEVIEVLK